ncbi:hypothetical protein APR04_004886 [Promicromonospora umidemergens]|uniref:DUF2946 family protein n=2 Tax=Promicromonospora umidemergens TaxID=629679 RepID=A0ABP8WDG4_9MICO|nr:hypothetical protein [Promicromonospora umidemergens]
MGALAILTVIIGVVTMHSMSGSPTLHMHHVPHEPSVAAAQHAAPLGLTPAQVSGVVDRSAASPSYSDTAGQPGTGVCHDGCGGHDLATAMCLMILVALLALVVPARRLLWRAPIEWSMPLLLAPAGADALGAPSLHELCISRT